MKELIECILKYAELNQQQTKLLESKARLIHIKKGEYFFEAGKVANQFGFMTEGVLRVCSFNEDGLDITKAFIPENHFVLNVTSFNNETPSEVYFEAVTDCILIVFSKESLNQLAFIIPALKDILFKISSTVLTNKFKINSVMLIQDGKTRYLEFLKLHPNLANRVPLSALASYLGINQSSLSRIRKNIR
jgi:CRP-like cAMP-binding protein